MPSGSSSTSGSYAHWKKAPKAGSPIPGLRLGGAAGVPNTSDSPRSAAGASVVALPVEVDTGVVVAPASAVSSTAVVSAPAVVSATAVVSAAADVGSTVALESSSSEPHADTAAAMATATAMNLTRLVLRLVVLVFFVIFPPLRYRPNRPTGTCK